MAQLIQHSSPPRSWRDVLIDRSVVITDAWEVTKTYAGRLAEWILFLCMVGNILEILPQVAVPLVVSNAILGVQTVTLDVAGFGLATMADQARANGDTKAANTARNTSYLLIGLMIVTVAIVTTGLLWPTMKPVTDIIDKALILVRVILTVVYGHVVHTLRRATSVYSAPQQLEQEIERLRQERAALVEQHHREVATLQQASEQTRTAFDEQERTAAQTLTQQTNELETLRATLAEREQCISEVQHQHDALLSTFDRLQTRERETRTLAHEANQETKRHTEKTRAIPSPAPTATNTGDIRERIRVIHQAEPELSSRKIADRLDKIVSHTTVSNHLKAIEAEQKESEA